MSAAPIKRINCYKCRHYFVTWDNQRPHGCRAMGFKSIQIPSMVVLKSSGVPCHLFEQKTR
ncbi:MAG: uracil-DNA glycosylase [Deltaproteobacteria bacterium]|nr:MAG: uracil-DNA glycosylase [Deltaproteobacteria bacterium]